MTGALRAVPLAACLALLFLSCGGRTELPRLSAADSLAIVKENIRHRAEADLFFASDPESPFRVDSNVVFTGLKWFPIDPRFRGRSILHREEHPETVTVMGTGGERRRQIRFGWFQFPVPGDHGEPVMLKLNVYRSLPDEEQEGNAHLSVWFTDRTTGKETYHVGRYVNVGDADPDPEHLYTIDLNRAYNPFCAYSDAYTCAVPRKEDHLDIALRVGEKPYRQDRNE